MIKLVLLTASNSNLVSSPPRLLSTTRRTKSSNLDQKERKSHLKLVEQTITAAQEYAVICYRIYFIL